MTRENILFAIIGILLGFIVGFMFASSMSQRMPEPQAANRSQAMPADHPPVGGAQNGPDPQAAELYYQIGRYDQSIEFLLKANQIQPTDYRTVTLLGLTNLDAGHYETAEKWYRAALKMRQDDVMVLAGLAAATLEKGDVKAAEDAIAQLEKVDPNSEDLPNFKTKLASLKASKSAAYYGEIDILTTFASSTRSIFPSRPTTTT
jgi:tetratricopeptide (TPR) repeat protein